MIFVFVIGILALLSAAIPATGLILSLVWLRTDVSAKKVTIAMAIVCGSTLAAMFLTVAAAFVVFNTTLDCMDGCSFGLPWE